MQLTKNDTRFVVQRLPRDVRDMLTKHEGKLFVGGGFVRAIIGSETPSDIDMFADTPERLELVARDLKEKRPGSRLHHTKNAITLITPNRLPLQFITRWLFTKPEELVKSFDFTVCQAAIWRSEDHSSGTAPWLSCIGDGFYIDLAGRRLVYTNPVREEEAGGSMMRVLKYVKRGYSIQPLSLGDVIARMTEKAEMQRAGNSGLSMGAIYGGLLREVDPLLVVDGFDVVDDHEQVEGE